MRMKLDDFLSKSPLTDEAFGQLIGCSQSQVSRLRRGESAPSPERIARIRDATGGKVDFKDFYPVTAKPAKSAGAAA